MKELDWEFDCPFDEMNNDDDGIKVNTVCVREAKFDDCGGDDVEIWEELGDVVPIVCENDWTVFDCDEVGEGDGMLTFLHP